MGKVLRKKNGQFNGMIGDGKQNIPQPVGELLLSHNVQPHIMQTRSREILSYLFSKLSFRKYRVARKFRKTLENPSQQHKLDMSIASSVTSSPQQLRKLATKGDLELACKLAENVKTDSETLNIVWNNLPKNDWFYYPIMSQIKEITSALSRHPNASNNLLEDMKHLKDNSTKSFVTYRYIGYDAEFMVGRRLDGLSATQVQKDWTQRQQVVTKRLAKQREEKKQNDNYLLKKYGATNWGEPEMLQNGVCPKYSRGGLNPSYVEVVERDEKTGGSLPYEW